MFSTHCLRVVLSSLLLKFVRLFFCLFTCLRLFYFLADRTNGRAYATVLRPSVCVLWLNGAS